MITKNDIVYEGKKRYYVEDLTQRDYFLECTTPCKLEYGEYCIKETSWGEMIRSLSFLLINIYPETGERIMDFQCAWSKQKMYSADKKTNFKEVNKSLYVNCNHTALHSCWFIQDLLDFFKINKSEVKLLIHRPPAAETSAIKAQLESHFKNEFVEFLKYGHNKDDGYANKVIIRIEKYLNPLLNKMSKSYTSLFLFDDYTIASSYIYKLKDIVSTRFSCDEKAQRTLNKYLSYLLEFYKL